MNKSIKIKIAIIKFLLKSVSIISTEICAAFAFRLFISPFRKPYPYKPPIFEKGEMISLHLNGFELKGFRWNIDAKKKILIAHGFESRAYNFHRYVDELVEKGYAVYAMDAKAHGDSEGKTITLPEYIAMFEQLEKRYGVFDGYISHSFGGIAVCLYEEQNNHPLSKLVLIAPATETQTAIRMFCKFFGLSDKIRLAMHDYIEKRSGKNINYYSIKRVMKKIKNEILWVHDVDDDITPIQDVQELIDENPKNIKFKITRGLGHRKIYKDPETLMNTVNFL